MKFRSLHCVEPVTSSYKFGEMTVMSVFTISSVKGVLFLNTTKTIKISDRYVSIKHEILFINIYFIAFKIFPFRYYTLEPAFFPAFETSHVVWFQN